MTEFEAFRHWFEECRRTEEIVSKLRQVEVLQGQGATIAEAVRQIGVTQQTFYRWRKLYGGMQRPAPLFSPRFSVSSVQGLVLS